MLKKLIYLSITTFSFSQEIIIKDFSFCENDVLEEHRSVNFANHQKTSEKVYLHKKYKNAFNSETLETLSKYTILSYGNGSKDFFVFADPQCKYCRAFAKGSMEHLDDATYHIILLPLEKHKDATKMMSFIMDGKNNVDRFNRYKSVLIDENFVPDSFVKASTKSLNYEKEILKLTSNSNIKSTPTFYKVDKFAVSRINWSEFNNAVAH